MWDCFRFMFALFNLVLIVVSAWVLIADQNIPLAFVLSMVSVVVALIGTQLKSKGEPLIIDVPNKPSDEVEDNGC